MEDFKLVTKITGDAKRFSWNSTLSHGYHLTQDVETRFGSNFLVANRFLKSADKVWNVILLRHRQLAREAFESLEQSTNEISGRFSAFLCVEAIVDCFKLVYEANIEFERTHEPTLHKVLPSLNFCIQELSKIEVGHGIIRGNDKVIRPSVCAMRLSGILKNELKNIEIHDLWLGACYLCPYLRSMSFWSDITERENFKQRAQALTRKMIDKDGATGTESMESGLKNQLFGSTEADDISDPSLTERPLKRRKFNLLDQIECESTQQNAVDEISRYATMHVSQFGINHETILPMPFEIVRFWYSLKSMFPNLSKITIGVFATPASLCSSERFFSMLKKLVSSERSMLFTERISKIIVARSLHSYE